MGFIELFKTNQPLLAKRKFPWYWLLPLIPILVYFTTVYRFAVNQPYADDYEAVLQFLIKYRHANGLGEKFLLLFSQHNEHRILSSRIVYVIYHAITGSINFRHLIFLSNLQLLVIFFIAYQFFKKYVPAFGWLLAIFASLILFDLNSYENANWAMAGMQNYGVVMFFLASLFFYDRNSKYALPLAMICQVMAAFSSGNGMIAGFALVAFNGFSKYRLKTICSAVLFIGCTILYFIDFYSPKVGHGAPVLLIIPFFLHSIGANFGFKAGIPGAVLLLAALGVCFPIQKKWKLDARALPLLSILLFVFASLGVTAVFRAGISMEVSYSTRYFIYPHLFVCIVFAFMLRKLDGTRWLRPAVAGCFIMFVAIYTVSYRYGTAGFARIRACIYDSNCYTDESIPRMQQIATDACNEGVFCTHLPAVKH